MIATSFGAAPKGSILSNQSLEYVTEENDRQKQPAMASLPTGILYDVPCECLRLAVISKS